MIHMAAISQIRHKHSQGRAYYDKKLAEGKTHKEALRSLKRRISDAVYAALVADARQAAAATRARRATGEPSLQGGRLHPHTSSGKPLPGLPPPYGPAPPQVAPQVSRTGPSAPGRAPRDRSKKPQTTT